MKVRLIKIGRADENDVVIEHKSVSRFHIELFRDEEGNVFITDLNTTNGTTINGTPLNGSKILTSNDVVKLAGANPLPWQNYFKDEITNRAPEAPKDVVVSSISPPSQKTSNTLVYWVIALLVMGLVAIVWIYFNTDSDTKKDSQKEVGTEVDQGEPNGRINDSPPPKRNIPQPALAEIEYDFSCMESEVLNTLSDLEKLAIDIADYQVTLSDEIAVGSQLYAGCLEEYTFVGGASLDKIREIKRNLVAGIREPRGFDYQIFLIQSDVVNAFTAGGYIFVTTAMYNFVNNNDELACVIGHEIAHNECRHINAQLSKQLALRDLLDEYFDSNAEALEYFLTTPFNQKRETECDFHGIDYSVEAGYDACKVIDLWKRMSEQEAQEDGVDAIMRTHPYSAVRSACCRNHIQSNYSYSCE